MTERATDHKWDELISQGRLASEMTHSSAGWLYAVARVSWKQIRPVERFHAHYRGKIGTCLVLFSWGDKQLATRNTVWAVGSQVGRIGPHGPNPTMLHGILIFV